MQTQSLGIPPLDIYIYILTTIKMMVVAINNDNNDNKKNIIVITTSITIIKITTSIIIINYDYYHYIIAYRMSFYMSFSIRGFSRAPNPFEGGGLCT